ncbi:unnamed protein product, partial [Amoebophrya sp. A25]
ALSDQESGSRVRLAKDCSPEAQSYEDHDLTVVIDEAAQATEADTMLALALNPSRLVLVGDPKQLAATVIRSKGLREAGYSRSLQSRLQPLQKENRRGFLDTQYRMHPEISLFPRNAYYGGKLRDGKPGNVAADGPLKSFALLMEKDAARNLGSTAAEALRDDVLVAAAAALLRRLLRAQDSARYLVVNHKYQEEREPGACSVKNSGEAWLVNA